MGVRFVDPDPTLPLEAQAVAVALAVMAETKQDRWHGGLAGHGGLSRHARMLVEDRGNVVAFLAGGRTVAACRACGWWQWASPDVRPPECVACGARTALARPCALVQTKE